MKTRYLIVAFCLSALCMFAGCAKEYKTDYCGDKDGIETEGGTEPKAYDKAIVSDMYVGNGSIEVYWEGEKQYDFDYEYQIPQINDNTEGAEEINALIHEEFDDLIKMIEESQGKLDETDMASWRKISYETFWNSNILSIVIASNANFEDYTEYKVYNYDMALGERITNDELLTMHSIPVDEFLTLARISAIKEFDRIIEEFKAFYTIDDTGELLPGFYTELMVNRWYTIQNEYNRNVAMPLYLNGNGELTVICCIAVPAEGGGFYSHLPLSRDVSEWENLKMVDIPDDYYDHELNKRILRLYEPEQKYALRTESKLADGTDYNCEYYLGFDSEFPSIFVFQDYSEGMHSLLYKGSLKAAGVDENGFIFDYGFTVLNGNPMPKGDELISGRFYMNPGWSYDEEKDEYEDYAIYRHISGGKLFETDEEEVKLTLVEE